MNIPVRIGMDTSKSVFLRRTRPVLCPAPRGMNHERNFKPHIPGASGLGRISSAHDSNHVRYPRKWPSRSEAAVMQTFNPTESEGRGHWRQGIK
jgi:hypothetical protein